MRSFSKCCLVFLAALSGAAHASEAPVRSTLDGIPIEAVEAAPGSRSHELRVGVGLFPFNAYYSGITVDGGYTYRFSNDWAWEVVNGSYAFTVEKGLTAELADKYHVNPNQIERLKYLATTAVAYSVAHGKMLLFGDSMRYFRASLLLGPGLVATDIANSLAANYGLKLEFFNRELFAWRVEIRDNMTLPKAEHYLTFAVGTGIRF